MSNVKEVVNSYIAAWNERDPRARRELIAKTWTEDGSYLDPHRNGESYDGISKMIAAPDSHTMFARPERLKLSARAAGIIATKNEMPRMQLLAAFLSPAPVTRGRTIFAGTSTRSVIAPMSR